MRCPRHERHAVSSEPLQSDLFEKGDFAHAQFHSQDVPAPAGGEAAAMRAAHLEPAAAAAAQDRVDQETAEALRKAIVLAAGVFAERETRN